MRAQYHHERVVPHVSDVGGDAGPGVAAPVVPGRPHVALRVGRVVVPPVRHRRHRHPAPHHAGKLQYIFV